MYEEHPLFTTPADSTPLWRYMSLAKYVSLLSSKSLFFARMTTLEDPYEGMLPKNYVRLFDSTDVDIKEIFARSKQCCGVNCWYSAERDSPAMWSGYGRGPDGIAIRTTVGQLKQALRTRRAVRIGAVVYLNYETTRTWPTDTYDGRPYVNGLQFICCKQDVFGHEREVRASISLGMTPGHFEGEPEEETEGGAQIRVSLNDLVQAVTVAPTSPAWYLEAVQKISARYDIEAAVTKSPLSSPPSW